MATTGEKILQVFSIKRKGFGKTSRDDHRSVYDVKEGKIRTERTEDKGIVSTRHGQSSVDHLESALVRLEWDLLKLRRSLERKETEMQKLKNEISALRAATAISSVQPAPQSKELSVVANHPDSLRSNAEEVSCLDYFLSATNNLKLEEGKIKTKTKTGLPIVKDTSSISSDTATASALGPVEKKLVEGDSVATSQEEPSTTNGSVSSHVRQLDVVDHELVAGVTKITRHESPSEISKPKFVEVYDHGRFDGDLRKCPDSVKGGLDIKSQSYVCETDDECFELDVHQSRSPPKSSRSSTEDLDDFAFPSPGRETYMSNSDIWTHVVGAAEDGLKSSCARSDLDAGENFAVINVKDHEEVEEKASSVSVDDERKHKLVLNRSNRMGSRKENGLTVVIPSKDAKVNRFVVVEDPLKVETSLKVAINKRSSAEEAPSTGMSKTTQQAVAVASRRAIDLCRALDEKSLQAEMRCVELDDHKLSKTTKSFRKVHTTTSSKFPDIVSRSTSMLSPPRPRPAQAQAAHHDAASVRSRSPDSQIRARNVLVPPKSPKSLTWTRNEREVELTALTAWRSDSQAEPMSWNSSSLVMENNNDDKRSAGRSAPVSPTSREASCNVLALSRHRRSMSELEATNSNDICSAPVSPTSREASCNVLALSRHRRSMSDATNRDDMCSAPVNPTSREASSSVLAATRHGRNISDATNSNDKLSTAPVSSPSREASCSVLALARQRRSMEICRSSVQSMQEIQKNVQEQWEWQDRLEMGPYVDDIYASNIQQSIYDDHAKLVQARQRVDDSSLFSMHMLHNSISNDKQDAQPAYSPQPLASKLESGLLSPPRRSRFFMEANNEYFSQVM